MALFAEDVPEGDRAAGEAEVGELELLHAFSDFGVVGAGLADAGEIALDVGGEDGNTDAAEALGHHLQGDGLPGAGCAGDEAVAVRHVGE